MLCLKNFSFRFRSSQESRNVRNAERGKKQATTIDDLPDEVLAQILSYVTDGRTLLDRASLVCRRWRAVCQWPHAWSGVTLRCADHADAARVLLHAPGLHSLTLAPSAASRPTTRRRLESALRRSRAMIFLRVHVTRAAWQTLSDDGRLAVAELLQRQHRQLRELDVFLDDGFLLSIVAQMRRLETLSLRLADAGVPYGGEFADGGLARLQELRVMKERRGEIMPTLPTEMVSDLVHGAASTLREVELDMHRDGLFLPSELLSLRALQNLMLHLYSVEPNDSNTGFVVRCGVWVALWSPRVDEIP